MKTTRSSELIEAIKRVARGAGALDPAAARAVMRQTRRQDPLLTLTQREHEVFDHLDRGRNAPEIAELLTVSEATVRTHVASILEKLALRDRAQVMAYAIKRGIVQAEDLMWVRDPCHSSHHILLPGNRNNLLKIRPATTTLITAGLLAHRPGNLFLLLAVAKSTYNRGNYLRNSPLKIIKSLQTFPVIESYANFLSKTSVH